MANPKPITYAKPASMTASKRREQTTKALRGLAVSFTAYGWRGCVTHVEGGYEGIKLHVGKG